MNGKPSAFSKLAAHFGPPFFDRRPHRMHRCRRRPHHHRQQSRGGGGSALSLVWPAVNNIALPPLSPAGRPNAKIVACQDGLVVVLGSYAI